MTGAPTPERPLSTEQVVLGPHPKIVKEPSMSCLNRKTLAIVAAVALAVLVFAPSAFGNAAPLLVAAACPLGMIFMMRGVAGGCRPKEARDAEGEGNASAAEVARLRDEVARLRAAQPDTGLDIPASTTAPSPMTAPRAEPRP